MKNESSVQTREVSPGRLAWGRFVSNRVAVVCLGFLVFLYVCAPLAPFIAPYGATVNNLEQSFHPPTPLHFADARGGFSLWPSVKGTTLTDRANTKYETVPGTVYPLKLFPRGDPYRLLGLIPCNRHLFGVEAPGRIFLLGSDQFGRDVFSRLVIGSQVSLTIGLVGILIVFPMALLVGGIAGYHSGWVDTGIMRVSEIIMSIPGLYLILSLRSSFPTSLSSTQVFLMITVIFSFIGWAGLCRVIRGMVLAEREKPYVLAARGLGQGHFRTILRHILPSTFGYCIVAATMSIPGYILGEAALSFLGLGIQDPDTSWGLMLAQAQSHRVLVSFWWILSPGFAIFAVVLAFNFLGDGLRDALDPKMKDNR
ncbi:MAG: ABC transporter permease [Verrucomicrobiae bacterium]|nr:ABC transporter permease [Verrucomicrobiae bacterium]